MKCDHLCEDSLEKASILAIRKLLRRARYRSNPLDAITAQKIQHDAKLKTTVIDTPAESHPSRRQKHMQCAVVYRPSLDI